MEEIKTTATSNHKRKMIAAFIFAGITLAGIITGFFTYSIRKPTLQLMMRLWMAASILLLRKYTGQ